jgi:hypothetical protein
MFIAMNRFQVVAGKEEDLERIWRERESWRTPVCPVCPAEVEMAAGGTSVRTWQDRESFGLDE